MSTAKDRYIAAIIDLMEKTETDLFGVLEHAILESDAFNLEDEQILSWLPVEVLVEARNWLANELKEQEEEEASPV